MNNSTEIFKQFYIDHYRQYVIFVTQIVGDVETGRDIVNDAFEYLWREWREMNIEHLQSYMYAWIKHRCIDHLRHQGVQDRYAESFVYLQAEYDDPFAQEDLHEKMKIVHQVLEHLPPTTRNIFMQCYYRHKKYAEVAEALDISPNTVKKHIMIALKALRQEISKYR